jgi:ABC-type transport system involved in multi-copper enzyme maturation permease subunit
MPLRLTQIRAMTHYELRMLWRQRMLVVFTLSVLALTGVLLIMLRRAAGDPVEFAQADHTVQWITLIWPLLYTQLLLLSGLAVIDVMMRDRVWGVKALLEATPLTQATYLLGKLCGAWLAILSSLVIIALGAGLLGLWLIGPYRVGQYIQMLLYGAFPLALLHVGLSLLLAACLTARRAAVMAVLLFSLACFMLWSFETHLTEISLWSLLNPARPYLYDYFWLGWIDRAHRTALGLDAIWLSIAIGVVELMAAGAIVWAWRRAREGRG